MRFLISAGLLLGLLLPGLRLPTPMPDRLLTSNQPADNSSAQALWNSNWVATDALGRSLPTPAETGPARANKYVGIFYFLWHGFHPGSIYDITKILKANPMQPVYGPKSAFHWWGEPEADYYKADDPWVIRRNLQMLTNAGIDILFIDVTNGETYLPTLKKLCVISQQMRQQGWKTPYFCFIMSTRPAETVAALYANIYATNQYSDLWFRWQGKPLMLGKQEDINDLTLRNFFTWRYSWQFTDAKNQPGHWQWLDNTPQNYGWVGDPTKPEEIPVAVASHPVFGVGKSYITGTGKQMAYSRTKMTSSTSEGRHFAEQWKRALAVDPSVVFVTGWNEWIAQRFVFDTTDRSMIFKTFIDHQLKQGETFFQDEYNEEFNRDIEPMKGGYTDDYYYQLVANVRRFKGLNAVEPATPAQTVAIDGNFTEWTVVKPVFRDFSGDAANRNWPRADNKVKLVNKTGRNDLLESRITHDKNFVYAYARTAKTLTPVTGRNWMLLFIDTDRSKKTGWEGYDLVVNRQVSAGGQTSVHRWVKGVWQAAGTATYKTNGDQLEVRIPLQLVSKQSVPAFDFHWADNMQRWNDITEFFLNGDSAPDRRFNYRYTGR